MATQTFEKWFAEFLGQPEVEVEKLLRDRTAVKFLIAWSLFETACFGGFMKATDVGPFSARMGNEGFDTSTIDEALRHFHLRYKEKKLYKNLMHETQCSSLEALLSKSIESLSLEDAIFVVTYVVYRFRNNIFHGNKGVASWLDYKEQIQLCVAVMQSFISHSAAIAQRDAA